MTCLLIHELKCISFLVFLAARVNRVDGCSPYLLWCFVMQLVSTFTTDNQEFAQEIQVTRYPPWP